jgi:hypothetical protein
MLTVTLDATHRWAVTRLDPGQALTVTAPPCVADVFGKEDRPWALVGYDDFGVRPTFTRNREFVHAHYTGSFAIELSAATKAIEADPDGPQVARIVFEPRGVKRKPTWYAIGHELVADDSSVRLDALAEFGSMLAALAAEGLSIPGAEALRLFRLARAAA